MLLLCKLSIASAANLNIGVFLGICICFVVVVYECWILGVLGGGVVEGEMGKMGIGGRGGELARSLAQIIEQGLNLSRS